MLYRMSYCSISQQPINLQLVHTLLMGARSSNQRDGITGMLLADGNRFMQILEGRRSAVRAAYQRIEADKRHRCLVELMRSESVKERWYPHWTMGYLPISSVELDDMIGSAVKKLEEQPTALWARSAQVLQTVMQSQGADLA